MGALHVTVEWLKGETDSYETDITDNKELLIRDSMERILGKLPYDLTNEEDAFSKDLLLLMLKQYESFVDSFEMACKSYKDNDNEEIAKVTQFASSKEYNEVMFLREVTPTVNTFTDMADIVRTYSKNSKVAATRLANLLSETSESV